MIKKVKKFNCLEMLAEIAERKWDGDVTFYEQLGGRLESGSQDRAIASVREKNNRKILVDRFTSVAEGLANRADTGEV